VAVALLASTVTWVRAPALAVGGTSGTINGTVTDTTTNAPVAGVLVLAFSPSTSQKTTTDAKGFFSFVGLPVDTYSISYTIAGYEPLIQQGITVQGDQTVTANGGLAKSLTRIGRTQSRAASAAFQPKQTTDSYQVTGAQVQTALGRAGNISQTQLQSSVPSVTTTFYGSSSIRGSTRTEISYQFDGIDYTDPLSSQFQNSLGLNGLQALQVNPGAGDATQGNAGAGAINIVVKRGARPSFGYLYLENDGQPRGNYGSVEWGWATPNGRISNYTSYVNTIINNQYGHLGSDQLLAGAFLATDYNKTSDLINNFVYKFGHDNSRSLQFLYQTRYSDFIINHGGIANLCYKTCDPNIASQLSSGTYFASGTAAQRLADMQRIIGLLPGQSDVNQMLYYQGFSHQPVDVMKLEYTQQIDPRTFWTNRLYRVIGNSVFDRPYDTQTTSSRVNEAQGGVRNGLNGDFLHQFGDKHLVDVSYTYQAAQSIYDNVSNTLSYRSLTNVNSGSTAHSYELADFLPSSGFTCPATDPFGFALVVNAFNGSRCGYLAQFFPGGIPRVPDNDFISPGYQHLWGFGIRDQFSVSDKLKLDYGIRMDGSDYAIVHSEGYGITNATKHPRVTEPRFAFAYQFGARDAVRFSYGRSVQFTPAGILNNPIAYFPQFYGIPSRDNRVNPPGQNGGPAMTCGAPLFVSLCPNYAQQVHDEIVNDLTGLEAYNVQPATYNNFDFSYSHQFKGNVGLKVTPFFKRGYNVNVFATPILGADPVSGLAIFGAPSLTSLGIDKTTGVELLLTKDRPIGLSGFLAMTYVNRLQNVPPLYAGQTEDFYPSIPPAALALGNLYRAGYLSPLNVRLGVNYKDKGGFRVNPIFSYDRGYPQVGAGLLAAAFVNNVPAIVANTNVSIPGNGTVANGGAPSVVSQYVSPTNPGNVFNPNIAATRGTPETALAGGVLTRARMNTDLDFEFSKPGTHNTIGLYISNLFNQIYAEPALNSRWQPVATGVAGPQTGQGSGTVLFGPQLGFFNFGPERFGQSAYTLGPNVAPTRFRLYYQLTF
jgi:hypothetical protein